MRKESITAHMVIVKMAQDDVLDAGTVNAEHGQALGWTAQELAPTPGAHGLGKTQVDDHGLCTVGEGPDEVGHLHGCVVRIAYEQFR